MNLNHPVIITITVPNREEGLRIAESLVEKKLVACVNLVPGLTSIYHWKGSICRDEELLLVAKSMNNRLDEIVQCVRSLHSYEVPEIVAIPIEGGSQPYLDWIKDSIQ